MLHHHNADEWQVASNVYGLPHAVVRCSESTTLEQFSTGILVDGSFEVEEDEKQNGGEIETNPVGLDVLNLVSQ